MEIYLIHNPTQVQERAPASQYTRAKTIFPYSLQFCSLPSIFQQSTDTSPREGIIPRKFKRGNSKLLLSQNHTNHESREGLSFSSATSLFISMANNSPDYCDTRRPIRTLSLRMPLPIRFNESLRTISNNKTLGASHSIYHQLLDTYIIQIRLLLQYLRSNCDRSKKQNKHF